MRLNGYTQISRTAHNFGNEMLQDFYYAKSKQKNTQIYMHDKH